MDDSLDNSLKQLIKIIDKHLETKPLKELDISNIQIINYLPYINLKINDYSKNMVFRNNKFEIIFISWYSNSIAPLHLHPKNGCILKVLKGKLQERRLFNNEILEKTILKENDISYIDDTIGPHEITALNFSISMHIYSPPGFYD